VFQRKKEKKLGANRGEKRMRAGTGEACQSPAPGTGGKRTTFWGIKKITREMPHVGWKNRTEVTGVSSQQKKAERERSHWERNTAHGLGRKEEGEKKRGGSLTTAWEDWAAGKALHSGRTEEQHPI